MKRFRIRRIFKRPSTRFFVALGLSSLLASVLLSAMYLGVVPDRVGAIRLGRAALAFVGDDDRRLTRLAHQIGKAAVSRREAGAAVDQKDDDIGVGNRRLGLRPHAAGKRVGRCIFQTGSVDHRERQIAEPALAFAAIASDARRIVD